MARKVVVLGDSIATRFGLSRNSQGFPQILRKTLASQEIRVISLARPGLMVTDTRTQIDRVIEMEPSVIVIVNGGRESLLRISGPLRLLRTDPQRSTASGWKGHIQLARRTLYKGFLAALQLPGARVITTVLRTGPHMHEIEFNTAFFQVLEAILSRSSARVITVVPCGFRMTTYPWDVQNNKDIQETIARGHLRSDRIECLDLRQQDYLYSGNFQRDGVHYSKRGHHLVAVALERMIGATAMNK